MHCASLVQSTQVWVVALQCEAPVPAQFVSERQATHARAAVSQYGVGREHMPSLAHAVAPTAPLDEPAPDDPPEEPPDATAPPSPRLGKVVLDPPHAVPTMTAIDPRKTIFKLRMGNQDGQLQVWVAVSHVDPGQSVFDRHSTQAMVAGSQIGLPPLPQLVLVMHCTQ